jgi:hypothetical protein
MTAIPHRTNANGVIKEETTGAWSCSHGQITHATRNDMQALGGRLV